MKKILVALLALVMAFSMLTASAEGASDKQYVIDKGVLVVGITDFEPMDYKDDEGNGSASTLTWPRLSPPSWA